MPPDHSLVDAVTVEATRIAAAREANLEFSSSEGCLLWGEACARARGPARDLDDRRLYWSRLAAGEAILRAASPFDPASPSDPASPLEALTALERASRGYDERFHDPDAVSVLISGFDPFLLDPDPSDPARFGAGAVRRANPSGAAVLALNGSFWEIDGRRVELRGAIFPVRYADFDLGVVESFFGPHLRRGVDLVMTISQGRSADFCVEQWAGRRRSAEAPDNVRRRSGGDQDAPVPPDGLGPGPEFLATALPSEAIWQALGRPGPLDDEQTLWERVDQLTRPARRPDPEAKAVRGSGGGYLSNEIFYRCARLRRELGVPTPLGHLHTPFLAPPANFPSAQAFEAARARIVDGVELALRAAVRAILAARC